LETNSEIAGSDLVRSVHDLEATRKQAELPETGSGNSSAIFRKRFAVRDCRPSHGNPAIKFPWRSSKSTIAGNLGANAFLLQPKMHLNQRKSRLQHRAYPDSREVRFWEWRDKNE
jgi:hypothetical protein